MVMKLMVLAVYAKTSNFITQFTRFITNLLCICNSEIFLIIRKFLKIYEKANFPNFHCIVVVINGLIFIASWRN